MYFSFVFPGVKSFQPLNEIETSLDLIHFPCFLENDTLLFLESSISTCQYTQFMIKIKVAD